MAVLFLAAIAPIAPVASGQERSGLRVLGFMPYALQKPFDLNSSINSIPRFYVDPGIHRGFLLAGEKGDKPTFVVYDLEKMRRIGQVAWPSNVDLTGVIPIVDPIRHRLFVIRPDGTSGNDCAAATTIVVVETRSLTAKVKEMPCVGGLPFSVLGMSYYGPANKLYAIGMPSYEYLENQVIASSQTRHSAILVQLNADTLEPEWSVNASAQCHWIITDDERAAIGRTGDNVVSFCYAGGASYNFGGVRGQGVNIPLKDDSPIMANGMPTIRVSPTYTDSVHVKIDPVTGRLLIRSNSPPFGPAVWGYDAVLERFFGTVPAGVAYGNGDDEFNGFDEVTGRLYRLTPRGIVMVDARQDVLSGGVIYPVLAGSHGGGQGDASISAEIGVDGSLHRLFFPYPERGGFVVVEDDVPLSPPPPPPDLDPGTADIPEVAGSTASAFSGAADAFGAHVILVGGIPGAIDNVDQSCFQNDSIPSPRNLDENRRCLADQHVTVGNREYFFGQSGLELGSDSGVSAFGSIFRVPPNDSATDVDFRSLAECFVDRFPDQSPGSVRESVGSFCRDQTPLAQFQNGTHDKDGKDVPFPGAICVDETGKKDEKGTQTLVGVTSVLCDNASRVASAKAAIGVLGLPDAVRPVLSIARATSSVSTTRGSEGLVTTVSATASGIDTADMFTIGRVRTEAVTKSHGRSGTTTATFTRLISDVHGPGIDCAATCDPQQVVDAFNQAFSFQGRLRTPSPLVLASPRGFQGLVVKDPNLRASDVAILNDDTDTFNGLDLILNNDGFNLNTSGPNARSRLVISLAGVHAESRYGIFPVLSGGGGDIPGGPVPGPLPSIGGPLPQPSVPVAPVPPPGPPTPVAQIITDTWKLIVNHPGQAAVLFVLLGLLGSPVYLGFRSRSLARSLRG